VKGRITNIGHGLEGDLTVTLSLPRQYTDDIKKLLDADIDAEIKKWREKRSLSANAYAWVLINKITEAITPPMDKQEVYLLMLRRYGQGGQVSIQTSQFESVIREFDYHKVIGTGMANGKEFTHADVLVGSSKYDTREMAVLIDGIIQEARDLGIDTDTPEQIARFKERWEGK